MAKMLTAFLILCWVGFFHSSLALAQQTQQPPPWNWPGPWHMWHDGWGFWWICSLIMFFMFIICGTIRLLSRRWGVGSRHREPLWPSMGRRGHVVGDQSDSALQILNERFAKSEIQKQEYEEKKAAILSSGQA
jgi:uncharacterized membrane protein